MDAGEPGTPRQASTDSDPPDPAAGDLQQAAGQASAAGAGAAAPAWCRIEAAGVRVGAGLYQGW